MTPGAGSNLPILEGDPAGQNNVAPDAEKIRNAQRILSRKRANADGPTVYRLRTLAPIGAQP